VSRKSPSRGSRPRGLPGTYESSYCESVIEAGKRGDSFEKYASSIDCHTDTLLEWARKYPDFGAARKKAKQEMLNFHMNIGKAAMTGDHKHAVGADGKPVVKAFNTAVWIFWMKARFGWREDGPADEDDTANDVAFKFT